MPDAAVAIVTKDRREDVLRAVESALAQRTPNGVEVIVLDDGSTDGTAAAVASRFPAARLIRSEESRGYIVRRNEAATIATAPILVNLDDDAEFMSAHVVAAAVAAFDHPRVGAVAIPLIDMPRGEAVRQVAPDDGAVYVTQQFMGTAGALRLHAFARIGGYPEVLEHQSEEPDYCLRLLAAGYVVRLGSGDPVRHYASPKRDLERIWYLGCRNDIAFGWRNVPLPDLLAYWLKTTLYELWLGYRVRRLGLFARGVMAGFRELGAFDRRPVSGRVYRLFRRLGKRASLRLDEIEDLLPPLKDA
jgi:glycosyltransferase involved in cell wall biosynthesis